MDQLSKACTGRDDHPNATALRPHSPHDHHRSGKGHPRGRRDQETGSGTGNAEAAMGSRGTGGFRGGYSQQNSFPSNKQYGHDSRGSFSQSPTPNSSYHNSPASQSPYNARSGRNGQQFSPSHPRRLQGLRAITIKIPITLPHSAPTGPMNPYPPNSQRGANYRGNSTSARGGGQFSTARGGHRAPGFKSGQWNPLRDLAKALAHTHLTDPMMGLARTLPRGLWTAVSKNRWMTGTSHGRPTRRKCKSTSPSPAWQQRNYCRYQPGTPTGPSSKFSFSFKLASKQTTTHPKPEITQKFNAVPTKQPAPKHRAKAATTSQTIRTETETEIGNESGNGTGIEIVTEIVTETANGIEVAGTGIGIENGIESDNENTRTPASAIPSVTVTVIGSGNGSETEIETETDLVIFLRVKKIEKRLIVRPKLEPTLAASKSVFFRKPGNESVVGSGTYGKVFKGLHVYTNGSVALKRIRMEGEQNGFPVTAVREVKLLQSLRHLNIVNLMEVMVEKNDCFMVFEYLSHDLTGLLNHPSFKLDDAQRKDLSKQLFDGLDYLHGRGKEGTLKLADFGLARFYAKRHQLDYTNRVLLLGETQYGPACDIWSAACVMMEIFVRSAIFPGDGTEMNQLERIYAVLGTPIQAEWPEIVEMAWFELLRPAHKVKRTFDAKLKDIDGDWHEFESKALRRENERKERRPARRQPRRRRPRDTKRLHTEQSQEKVQHPA
ncbi:unnamed protein product [Parascedosporium putredinis]|uniref:cyclin-dependent kinase n=1 Tax=Parascedosporium putredinis TaxID=1442378 RepID=A0A9P1H1M5_9PEZI|nr:unnamed protein product [Parascedosporium putredinis]CAI7993190.1 unnamed protein product [Parascedosporium putredinis]